jgi:hypothetical protein
MIIPRAVLLTNSYRYLPFITVPFEAERLPPPVTQKTLPKGFIKIFRGTNGDLPFLGLKTNGVCSYPKFPIMTFLKIIL